MTTFTENLDNAKTAQDKYFFEGGGARKASNALLAALMLGFSPAIAADNSVVTNSSPLAGEARWGINSNKTLTPAPSTGGAGEINTLSTQGAVTLTPELTAQDGEDLLALEDTTLTFPDPMGDGAVSFTPVTEKDDNTITQFQYNQTTGGFEPVFYRVDVKTEYGTGDTTLNFGWEEGADGIPTFTQNPTAPIAPEIIYKYDSKTPTNTAMTITTDMSDTDISGNFIGLDDVAIQNGTYDISPGLSGRLGNINANFISNSGFGIYNYNKSRIENITGNFISNSGAIKNESGSSIGNIRGNFIGNTTANGSVIFNGYSSTVGDITGNFIGNTTTENTGAIDNTYHMGNITGNFIGNIGGAITNRINPSAMGHEEEIGNINGTFINNCKIGTNVSGGAILNEYVMGDSINKQLAENTIKYGKTVFVNEVTGEQISVAIPGLEKELTIEEFKEYLNNGTKVVKTEYTMQVSEEEFVMYKEVVEQLLGLGYTTDYIDIPEENLATTTSGIFNSLFVGNYVKTESGTAYGGAIANNGTIGEEDGINTESINNGIINSSFYNNYAESESGEAKGGAIYSTTDITIAANNGESIFSGNKVINNGVEESNAIYMGTNVTSKYDSELDETVYTQHAATLTLDARNNGLVYFDDKIDGLSTTTGQYYIESNPETGKNEKIWLEKKENDRYNVELTGDGTGKIVLNNDIMNADLRMNEGANVYLGREDVWDSDNVTLNGGSLFLLNNKAGTANFDTLSISADTDLMVDVDLANSAMDRVSADSYGELKGNINVVGMNLLSDADSDLTEILFADNELKNNVTYGGAELPDNFQTTAYTPIYKYDVAYGVKDDGGYFTFNRLGGSSGGSDAFNPAVLGSPVASQAANQSALNEVFHYSYEHVDSFTKLPAFERYAKINANKYAMSTDFNDNMPSYAEQLYNKGVWFKPFTTFESLPLKNGPKVDAITYGSLVGFDTDFKELGNGWHSVFSGFAGYVGSSLNYSGVDSTMNGGLLGFTETFYKGNFWTAVSATAGASVGETHNMYGKEDYTSLLAGVGSKTGYNFEFKEGRFIIQPIMYLGYTFVNTFDYKNSAGVNIESDPLHTIQINPSVRFIANLKGGWQPYASVGMVWNLMNETKATANNVRLPEMSVKPYVEYGVGVQRNWADKFTAYLQAMIRNGGRNGVSLTGGFRFMLGSDDDNDSPKVKKEIKSL